MRVRGVSGSAQAGFGREGRARRERALAGARGEAPPGAFSSLLTHVGGIAVVGAVRARWRQRRRRALADEWLAWGAAARQESRLLGPRADELTSAKTRRALARVCRRYVAEISDPPCRAYAVNRIALREHVGLLARLGDRLADLTKPVSAGSVLLAREVMDGNGPLFNRERADELGPALKRALRALEQDEALPPS